MIGNEPVKKCAVWKVNLVQNLTDSNSNFVFKMQIFSIALIFLRACYNTFLSMNEHYACGKILSILKNEQCMHWTCKMNCNKAVSLMARRHAIFTIFVVVENSFGDVVYDDVMFLCLNLSSTLKFKLPIIAPRHIIKHCKHLEIKYVCLCILMWKIW